MQTPRRRAFALRQILWPCDLGATSEHALEQATALARLAGAEILALHVVAATLPPSGGLASIPNPELLDPALRPRLIRVLQRFLDSARRAGVSARPEVRVGKPAQVILRLASSLPADLVVMGAHARGRLEKWLLGSVAERVLRQAPCPVLLVRGADRSAAAPFRTILCATDFRAPAATALRSAAALAHDCHARLIVAHVIEDAPLRNTFRRTASTGSWSAVEARARAGLRAALAKVPKAHARETEGIVVRGRPHEAILRLARERKADLLVVGRGRLSRLVTFGSCARRVCEAAACPVLVIGGT